jgi:hypothetical protein
MVEDETDLEWLVDRNERFLRGKGAYAMYRIDHHEGRLYFYNREADYPDTPAIRYPGETIGTWAPRSKTFMWSCDNNTAVESSNAISMKARKWFTSNGASFITGVPGVMLIGSIDLAWKVVSIAAKLSNVVAVYNSPCTYGNVKDELEATGKKVPRYMKNKILNYEFFAITGEKHEVKR